MPSLWGAAPTLIERLAAACPDEALVADAQQWLDEARSIPRYDWRVGAILDTEVQRLATRADETEGPAVESIVRRALHVREVLDDVIAGNWPRPAR